MRELGARRTRVWTSRTGSMSPRSRRITASRPRVSDSLSLRGFSAFVAVADRGRIGRPGPESGSLNGVELPHLELLENANEESGCTDRRTRDGLMRRRHSIREAVALGLFLIATGASAQDTTLQFSFANPGARSVGFGGAFVALADDATAAFANPAGLVQLTRPEVSIEGRHWSYDTTFTEGGRAFGEPTGIGLDTSSGLRFGSSSDEISGLAFVSFIYPVDGWSLAIYRHQLADFESRPATQGLFSTLDGAPSRQFDRMVRTDLDITAYGLSVGKRLSDTFSVGAGITYFEGGLNAHDEFFDVDRSTLDGLFGPNPYLPELLALTEEVLPRGDDLGLIAGFLWQISRQWAVGGVFRQGPDLEFDRIFFTGPGLEPEVPAGTVLQRNTGAPIEFPDVLGLGWAYRSKSEVLTLSFEWSRVEYSVILESVGKTLNVETLALDDADELHVGVEYVFIHSSPLVALRFGTWLDPAHRVHGGRHAFDRAVFQPGDDEIHLALGLGVAFANFQIDLGADFSDLVDTATLSAIYSF